MIYEWYKIFNKVEFEADDVPSRTVLLQLEDWGRVTFEVFRGNYTSIFYDDVLLPVQFLDQNPYAQGGYAVYRDGNDDVWFGFEVEE